MKVAFLARDIDYQAEGLRSSLGLVVENMEVSFFLLDHELDPKLAADEDFKDRLFMFHDDMEGPIYSNVKENEKHGFEILGIEEIGKKLHDFDLVIPF